MINLTLSDYQREARRTAIYPDMGKNLTYPIMGLIGEAGELANHWAKVLRSGEPMDPQRREAMVGELGDMLWFIVACCDELDTNLGYVAWANLRKLKGRKVRGVIQGDGDDR